MMRTTINIPDDIYNVVRSFAAAKGLPLGEAVAELVQKGLLSERRVRSQSPFPSFTIPDGVAPITLEQTLSAEDEL